MMEDINKKFFVQDISCTIQLKVHQWKVVFSYHGEVVCLKNVGKVRCQNIMFGRLPNGWLKNIWKIGGLKNCASL